MPFHSDWSLLNEVLLVLNQEENIFTVYNQAPWTETNTSIHAFAYCVAWGIGACNGEPSIDRKTPFIHVNMEQRGFQSKASFAPFAGLFLYENRAQAYFLTEAFSGIHQVWFAHSQSYFRKISFQFLLLLNSYGAFLSYKQRNWAWKLVRYKKLPQFSKPVYG